MLEPTFQQLVRLNQVCKLLYPTFDHLRDTHTSDGIKLINTDGNPITYVPDWHTLIDHLRRELATWHATTQRELWQIIEPEVRGQIAEIVGIESDGY